MPVIFLNNHVFTTISLQDYEEVSKYIWWEHKDGNRTSYAYRIEKYECPILKIRRRRKIYLHRQITNAPDYFIVDHQDGDGLMNVRSNLRYASRQENNANKAVTSMSGYKGVSRSGRYTWRVRISTDIGELSLGTFTDLEEAARTYDKKALEVYGEFAWTNFEYDRPIEKSYDDNIPF